MERILRMRLLRSRKILSKFIGTAQVEAELRTLVCTWTSYEMNSVAKFGAVKAANLVAKSEFCQKILTRILNLLVKDKTKAQEWAENVILIQERILTAVQSIEEKVDLVLKEPQL